jgi:ubiquinone biosynthesis monooxygenase Coq7
MKHLEVMTKLVQQHRVRPSLLLEVAKIAGWSLGAATALMGKTAAMTCTEAVETVIGEHYDELAITYRLGCLALIKLPLFSQLRDLDSFPVSHPSIPELKSLIRELRDDELEHLDTAVDFDSQKAPAHALLSAVIGTGCNIAIQLCKRI